MFVLFVLGYKGSDLFWISKFFEHFVADIDFWCGIHKAHVRRFVDDELVAFFGGNALYGGENITKDIVKAVK